MRRPLRISLTTTAAILISPPAQSVPLGAGSFVVAGAETLPFHSRGPPAHS